VDKAAIDSTDNDYVNIRKSEMSNKLRWKKISVGCNNKRRRYTIYGGMIIAHSYGTLCAKLKRYGWSSAIQ